MKVWTQSFSSFIACAVLLFGLSACSGGGSGGGETTTPPVSAAGSVTITGTVSGTVIKILNAETNTLISQFDTATLNQAPLVRLYAEQCPGRDQGKTFLYHGGSSLPAALRKSSDERL